MIRTKKTNLNNLAKILLIVFFLAGFNFAQFRNYRVSAPGSNSPEEVTIAINPLEPNVLAAGANISYSFRSENSGKTWSQQNLSSIYGVWGDPVTRFDAHGNLYFVHLSNPGNGYWIDRIVIQKSTDNGVTFNQGTHTGVYAPHNQDKAWIAIDMTDSPYKDNLYVTWTEFDSYGSTNPNDSSRILFSKSSDFAETWSEAKVISDKSGDCVDADNTDEGAVPAVGPNGEIYVAWSGPYGIMFDKSLDGGETWGKDIFVTDQIGGWDYGVSGVYRANGLPVTVCDTSHSPTRGNIYVMWTDQRNGDTNPDVFIIKSTDGGETWGDVVRVNNDNTERPQFFAAMAVDQTNGNIYVSFYDRRNTTGTDTEYYLARSTDGGETFDNYVVTDAPFPMFSQVFFGDYTDIAAYEGKIYPIWMETDASHNLSVWTAPINDSDLPTGVNDNIGAAPSEFTLEQNYPNPFGNKSFSGEDFTTIEFSLKRESFVTLKVYDILGSEITTILNKVENAGVHDVRFFAGRLNLTSGIYFYRLQAGSFSQTKKMTIIR